MRKAILVAGVIFIGLAGYLGLSPEAPQPSAVNGAKGAAMAEIVLPTTLSSNATIGKTAFEAKCAKCHGINAAGLAGVAPPLIHKIYEPSHHGDEAFQRAASNGARAHHWPFGNMPPVEGLTRGDVEMIVAFVREVQHANGIQ